MTPPADNPDKKAVENLILNAIRWEIVRPIDLMGPFTSDSFQVNLKAAGGRLWATFRAEILARDTLRQRQRVEETVWAFPRTWWDHVKYAFLPHKFMAWWYRKFGWPLATFVRIVATRTTIVKEFKMCPHLGIQPLGDHVRWTGDMSLAHRNN